LATSNIVIERGYDVFVNYIKKNNIDPVVIATYMIDHGGRSSEPYLRTILAFIYDFKIWDKIDSIPVFRELAQIVSIDSVGGWVAHSGMTPSDYARAFNLNIDLPTLVISGIDENLKNGEYQKALDGILRLRLFNKYPVALIILNGISKISQEFLSNNHWRFDDDSLIAELKEAAENLIQSGDIKNARKIILGFEFDDLKPLIESEYLNR
jgi:hypothetical protein